VTISALATAGGTLVLAGATFASVRSANRSSRLAERSLLATQRPLLMPSRLQDDPQKVGFADGKWLMAPGGGGAVDVSDEAVYLVISLRNVGPGMAVLHGWLFHPEVALGDEPAPSGWVQPADPGPVRAHVRHRLLAGCVPGSRVTRVRRCP